VDFTDGGSDDGSFEDLLGYKDPKSNIGLPTYLKAALTTQKANVPLAGVFEGGGYAVVFYISKN
jgi:hypothetical protein